jgi:hypothetical protein
MFVVSNSLSERIGATFDQVSGIEATFDQVNGIGAIFDRPAEAGLDCRCG